MAEVFDINSLTYREAIDFERAAQISIMDLGKEGIPMMGVLAAFQWIVERRTNPGLTFDEFIDSKVDLEDVGIETVAPTPTSGDESKPSA